MTPLLLLLACGREAPVAPSAEGELLVEQIGLGSSAIGEAALVVGPDGTRVLLDVGNDRHADEVEAAVRARTGEAAVDWVVLTHHHADHLGGFDDLVERVTIRLGVVWRGMVDLDGANRSEAEEVCAWLEGAPDRRFDLCAGGPSSCDAEGAFPATACDGLSQGDLLDPSDEGVATIDLGDGARLVLAAVDGHVRGEGGVVAFGEMEGDPDDVENARSVVGAVTWGRFRYVFGGDLTGGGKETPDLEAFVAAEASALPADADVLHLHHHGIRSSTGDAWVERFLPLDGRSRHAVVGANGMYLAAPAEEVLDRVGGRIGEGSVWVTEDGSLAGSHERLRVMGGSVVVRVVDGGAAYAIGEDGAEPVWESAGGP